MGHKVVCLNCQIAFSHGTNFNDRRDSTCPSCGQLMMDLPHRFRPPKKTDDRKWQVVKYLIENGFYYQHIYDNNESNNYYKPQNYVEYPDNIMDAKEFVEKYKNQAIKQ